jgi:hypothetical protein
MLLAETDSMGYPPRPGPSEGQEMRKRRRGRNIAMLVVLIGLCLLFYAIAIVKLTKT